ncbi:GNAT family N-acetyltransferase [Methylocystis iwaonis]|uniref:N-acetyltransferase n=1 Tax=Methylocystis iwaonis TaxID=2885079 RepID=A0ABM8E624_9HYPH|nr:GNAT family N-acetyltransferase [Methylocystis iwaonis]BDV33400.1 N-acetyltransferase [Methylocystis iwaonis]
MTIVRDMRAPDAEDWRRLWAGYNAFYESTVPADVTEYTLRRLLDPSSPLIGRIAETDGRIAGFTISVLHESTWTMAPSCYLEDLFVDPGLRGGGVGQALIQDLIDLGRAQGWSRIYWHTRTDNARARRLYDKFAGADDFVRYRLTL